MSGYKKQGGAKMKTIDPYITKHLDAFIENHITDSDADAFRNYALARLEDDLERALNIGWSILYGQFLMKT